MGSMQVFLVLKSGGIYTVNHARILAEQIQRNLPSAGISCLTDLEQPAGTVKIPLKYQLLGWWSKLEMFRPGIAGDILYFDLDTVITGSLIDIAAADRLTLLRDFYRDGTRKPEGLQSSMMFLPEADRAEVWNAFIADPKKIMRECAAGGDQEFLERFYLQRAQRWQDVVPDQIASYKVHCKQGVPAGTRVVCAHGKPKLWNTPEFKHLYE